MQFRRKDMEAVSTLRWEEKDETMYYRASLSANSKEPVILDSMNVSEALRITTLFSNTLQSRRKGNICIRVVANA